MFPKKISHYLLLVVTALFFLSMTCGEEFEYFEPVTVSVPITEVHVSVLDNSGKYPVPLSEDKCQAKALVLKIDPVWDEPDSCRNFSVNSLAQPIRSLEIVRIDDMGETDVSSKFDTYIGPAENMYKILKFRKYDDVTGAIWEVRCLDGPEDTFLMACINNPQTLVGLCRFRATLTFADGSTISGETETINVY